MATRYTLAGTAKARGLGSVDPRLVQIIEAAAARSPYQVQIFSGKRFGAAGGSRHNSGNAIDIALIDPTTGQAIPNYKSSTGFPIYAEFAKVAREEQMRLAPDMADQFRWGGGFSDKSFDLMHFDFKPGGAMAYWSWNNGGELTEAGRRDIPKFGAGKIYANGQVTNAPAGQYASLWGREPLQAQPETAQSAIASLVNPPGGTLVPDAPSPMMAFANQPQTPAQPVAGSTATDTMLGGPMPPTPRLRPPADPLDEAMFGSGPHRGDARTRPDTFQWMGGGAPANPPTPNLSPASQASVDRLDAAMMPRPRPDNFVWDGGGAPDNPPNPPRLPGFEPMVAGRPEFPGAMPPAPQVPDQNRAYRDFIGSELFRKFDGAPPSGDMLGRATPQPLPRPFPPRPAFIGLNGGRSIPAYNDWTRAFDVPGPMTRMQESPSFPTPETFNRGPSFDFANPGDTFGMPRPTQGAATEPGMGLGPYGMNVPPPDFSMADASPAPNAGQMFGLPPLNGASFPPPTPIPGTVAAGSTGGEFFTPPPPTPPDPNAGRFDAAFSGGPGTIMDLQSAFNQSQGKPPPSMNAQDGINSVFGAPPVQAQPPNIAIPFNEVPGFDAGRFMGSASAEAATVASPLPHPGMGPPSITPAQFDERFGGGSVVAPPQAPEVSLDVQYPEGAMDIRPPSMGGPALVPGLAAPAPPAPRQTSRGEENQRKGILGRILGGVFGGPLGAMGGGLLGGGGGFGFGGQAAFTPFAGAPMIQTGLGSYRASGTGPNASGGSTNWSHGTTGNMNSTSWNRNGGGSVVVAQDPFTGSYITGYSQSAI